MHKNDILKQFDSLQANADEFASSMKALITMLIHSAEIEPHSITSRVKDRDSLSKKISKKSKYSHISEITDIIGLRVISLYSDEVDRIAELIENEFEIDADNSIDKRAALDPDRFGYLSLHYVVSLNQQRKELKEYSRFSEFQFEIQIRSILQHTWAEIEHDIGYKSKIEVPKSARRQFSRLAGLLELADIEFENIRNRLSNYESEVEKEIHNSPELIEIDKVSITELVNNNEYIKSLDQQLIKLANISHVKEATYETTSYDVRFAEFFNIENIAEFLSLLKENQENILIRASDADASGGSSYNGISLFYLSHVLAAKLPNDKQRQQFIDHVHVRNTSGEFLAYLNDLSKKIT